MNNQQTSSILIVDDQADNFDVLKILLFKDGYQLNYVQDASAALEYLEKYLPGPDVILLDVMMPGMSGIDLCTYIKHQPQWRQIPIIMVTALTAKEDLADCLNAGADDFISKPIHGVELRARVRSMLRIKQQYDALQSMIQLRNDMSNMVVHDLRNPLTNIILSCDILGHTGLSAKQQQKVELIRIASRRLQSMIDTLLMMSKLEAGRLSLNLKRLDICTIGRQAVKDCEAIAAQKQIKITTKLAAYSRQVLLDASLCRRVFDNLLSNALKFAPSNSEIILVIDYPTVDNAQIKVIDSGPGIKEELREKIFQKYEIGEVIQGISQMGLGLAFCKIAVEAQGGQINIESNLPRGTIVVVTLPIS